MDLQEYYHNAMAFAGAKHGEQKIPGTETSYLLHLSKVAMEIIVASQYSKNFNVIFATQVALLHDVIEDTPTTVQEVSETFGPEIAAAVLALTKNENLERDEQIPDSLSRIKKQPKEVWAVKIADRISNLYKPPSHWNNEKIKDYWLMAKVILEQLKGGNDYLEDRLRKRIDEYRQYVEEAI